MSNFSPSAVLSSLTSSQQQTLKVASFGAFHGIFLLYTRYQQLTNSMLDRTLNDKALWKNDYPIILVHGYCGTTMDENWILGGYFHYAFSKLARVLHDSSDSKGVKYLRNVYEVDVSPIGSAFDRACELYQMIIGIKRVEEIAKRTGQSIGEVVYGKQHYNEVHKNSYYKVRYLKTQDPQTGKMYALPNGLPHFNDFEKIHFVGHSMGAITVRMLQKLLKQGYFDEISQIPIQDRSSIVASLTCIAGANNGSMVVNNCGMYYSRQDGHRWKLKKDGKMIWAFKQTIFWQNFFKTQNRQLERIKAEHIIIKYKHSLSIYDTRGKTSLQLEFFRSLVLNCSFYMYFIKGIHILIKAAIYSPWRYTIQFTLALDKFKGTFQDPIFGQELAEQAQIYSVPRVALGTQN